MRDEGGGGVGAGGRAHGEQGQREEIYLNRAEQSAAKHTQDKPPHTHTRTHTSHTKHAHATSKKVLDPASPINWVLSYWTLRVFKDMMPADLQAQSW